MEMFGLPASEAPPPKRRGGLSVALIGDIAVWLMLATFGGLIWTINGGFSVAGLEAIALAFNAEGAIFWQAASSWTFALPVSIAGLPVVQPVIPWIGVLSASMLQVIVVYARRRGVALPAHVTIAAVIMSLYDVVTTFQGAGTIEWIASSGIIVQLMITLFITFSFETTIGYLLKR